MEQQPDVTLIPLTCRKCGFRYTETVEVLKSSTFESRCPSCGKPDLFEARDFQLYQPPVT